MNVAGLGQQGQDRHAVLAASVRREIAISAASPWPEEHALAPAAVAWAWFRGGRESNRAKLSNLGRRAVKIVAWNWGEQTVAVISGWKSARTLDDLMQNFNLDERRS